MMLSRLQYISQGITAEEQLINIQSALEAGCDWIQLRFKNVDDSVFSETAREVQSLCKKHQAIFIINDRVKLAAELDADGVHIGLEDMPVAEARKILGPVKIIGGTANTMEHVWMRVQEQCNYVGLGPFRFTSTKEKLSPILGVEGYRKIMLELQSKQTNIPVYAIGGIAPEDVETIMNTGVYGIAVSGVISHSTDKKQLIEHLNHSLHANTSYSR